jgi:hypothetical protein
MPEAHNQLEPHIGGWERTHPQQKKSQAKFGRERSHGESYRNTCSGKTTTAETYEPNKIRNIGTPQLV